MSVNLVSLASQYLTPGILAKISSTLGLDRSVAGKACSAAIPALFGSFANLSSNPDGARKLYGAVSQQSTNILDDLASVIGGSTQHGALDNQLSSLRSLLGGSSLSTLASTLGKFAGLGQSSATSLLGMIAPILMAVLGKQSIEHGLDSSGISRLLASQKDNIAAAMPSGFSDLLQPSAVQRSVPQSSSFSTDKAPSSWGGNAWLWVLPLVAVGLLAWWIGNRRTHVAEETATNVAQQARPESVQTPGKVIVAAADVKSSTQKAIDSVNTTLHDIKDEHSAQAALPKLQSAGTELDNAIKLSGQLPEAGKKAVGGTVAAAQPTITQLFDKVLAIPGVKEVAKPQIDALREKIATLGKEQEPEASQTADR